MTGATTSDRQTTENNIRMMLLQQYKLCYVYTPLVLKYTFGFLYMPVFLNYTLFLCGACIVNVQYTTISLHACFFKLHIVSLWCLHSERAVYYYAIKVGSSKTYVYLRMLAQTQAFELITQSAFTSGAYPEIRGAGGGGDHE